MPPTLVSLVVLDCEESKKKKLLHENRFSPSLPLRDKQKNCAFPVFSGHVLISAPIDFKNALSIIIVRCAGC